ncbi:MAG: glycosyltransferase family 4 protein [Solirubrobacterales bacterium]|nr:glycosyltransferase family 4 protein [Solirubrobacterales bacterium]
MSRLKVAVVCPRYEPEWGGIETHVSQLVRRLAHEAEIEVLTQTSDDSLPRVERRAGALVRRFHVVTPSVNYAWAPTLWTYLARNRHSWDVVHAHHYHALPALGAALGSVAPLVLTPHFHGTGHTAFRRALHVIYRPVGRLLVSRARRIICVTAAERRLLSDRFPGSVPRAVVIPNGVECEPLATATPFASQGPVILVSGRLEAYKHPVAAVDALSLLPGDVTLKITGDGPERGALEQRIRQQQLSGRAELLGRVSDEDLRRWMRTARVLVSMSEHEAYGIVLLEALAAGASVVASDIPAHREIATLYGAGRIQLVPVGASAEVVANAIRRQLATTPRSSALPALPTWDGAAEATLALYRELAQGGRSVIPTQLAPSTV